MNVAIKSVLAAMVLLASSVSVVNAAGAGTGSVTFSGEILESACSITPQSVDQQVSLGSVSKSQLNNSGVGTKQYFDIELTGCSLTDLSAKTVTATFTGAGTTAVPGALALNGVTGAGILLTEFDGTAITLGTATTAKGITAGSNTLTFGAQLKGQPTATGTVGTGTFDAVTHFALAYQ
ncbi:fimbria A protein [Pseudomonas fragi]|uniref:Fimbria A protein n=1 Tax=Pseudomonas fragi TaxID=296 RepID=A0A266LYI0_PSEFR|nr:fimbrial protein [Pseudomonas fragi]OZY42365.1 fimbria A protein [Pseudomonas fragi]